MKWIALSDERTPEILEKHGITWQLPAPREVDADGLLIHPRRLRRLIRTGGGLGTLTVANATIESPTYVGGSVNLDGTLSMTGAQRKSRTNRGTIKRDDNYQSGDGFRRVNSTLYRPDGQVDIDLSEIREKLRNSNRDTNPHSWANAIDRSVKSGIVESSIRANVLDTTFFPEIAGAPIIGKPLFLGVAGLKVWFAYRGVTEIAQGVDTMSHVIDWAAATASANVFQGALAGLWLKGLEGRDDISLRDFKPSLVDPQIPLDRPILAGIQQYMSPPVIRYSQPTG